jgi:peptide/nickel transport system permease protein
LVIPVAVLALGMLPVLERHVRAAVSEALDTPFALAARAHGIPRARILYRHVLPAALHPLIALFGFSLGTLLSASLLIEVLVGWPGLGPLFLDAVLARDFAIVLGVVMVSATTLIAANIAADLLLYRADPRIRLR